MISLLLGAAILAASPVPGSELPDGTLLYLTHSNKAVHLVTDSEITHVALLVGNSVYEATPAKVRRIALRDYHHELSELNASRAQAMRLFAMRPSSEFKPSQVERMQAYLDEQLGRRYSVKGYVREREGDGIHCAELVSGAIGRTGRAQFSRNYLLTPGEVVQRVSSVYAPARRLDIVTKPVAKQSSWCERSWGKCSSWTNWCGWSLRESWSWCW